MKKILALILALCMVFCLCACGQSEAPAEEPAAAEADAAEAPAEEAAAEEGGTIVIGVFEPLSGASGAGGKQEALGVQYANSVAPTVEINGVTYDVKLEMSDNESSTDKAVSAATQLVAAGSSVVLGTYGSGVAIAASDTFGDAGIPAIGITCTNPQVTEGNDHYFRICFLDPFQGTVQANFAHDELGVTTKAYVLAETGNDYDQGLANYFTEAAEALGIEVTLESFPKGNADFTSYINNAKSAGAEVIFAPTDITNGLLIIEAAFSQGLEVPIIAPDTWDNNQLLASAEGTGLDIYCSTFYAEGGDPDFEEGFKAWINSDETNLTNNGGNDMIAAVSVMGYDAYFTALEAIKNAGSADAADILEALPSTTYTGVSGAIAFDEIGDAVRDAAFIKKANTETVVWDFVAQQTVADLAE